jgi:TonB family protein
MLIRISKVVIAASAIVLGAWAHAQPDSAKWTLYSYFLWEWEVIAPSDGPMSDIGKCGESCRWLKGKFSVAQGMLNGEGLMVYPDGRREEGTFENGQFVRGKTSWPGGSIDGAYTETKLKGLVHVAHVTGDRDDALFAAGVRNGASTQVFPDGTKLECVFVKDEPSGDCVLTENATRTNGAYVLPTVDRAQPIGDIYPPMSLRLGETGWTGLSLVVDTDGKILNVLIQRSSGSVRLDAAATNAAMLKYRFRPGTFAGRPIRTPDFQFAVGFHITAPAADPQPAPAPAH